MWVLAHTLALRFRNPAWDYGVAGTLLEVKEVRCGVTEDHCSVDDSRQLEVVDSEPVGELASLEEPREVQKGQLPIPSCSPRPSPLSESLRKGVDDPNLIVCDVKKVKLGQKLRGDLSVVL